MTVEKPKPKQLRRPITTGTNSATNQSQFLAITCNSLEARVKSRVHGAIGLDFASHRLKNWREPFKAITKAQQSQSRNYFPQSFENCAIIYFACPFLFCQIRDYSLCRFPKHRASPPWPKVIFTCMALFVGYKAMQVKITFGQGGLALCLGNLHSE